MINSEPAVPPGGQTPGEQTPAEQTPGDQVGERLDAILRSGARGALTLAGIATFVVMAIWFAFYFVVFVPRAVVP